MLIRPQAWTRLVDLLIEIGNIPREALQEGSKIGTDIVLESVAFVEITVALEEHFDIEIDPLEVLDCKNLGEIADYIAAHIAQRDSARPSVPTD